MVRWRTLLRWRLVLAALGALILGLTPFIYEPVRAAYFPAINEGAPTGCATKLEASCTFSDLTKDRLMANINREQYGKKLERGAPYSAQVGMWWLYFQLSGGTQLRSLPRVFAWGYGHYFIWAAAAAVGAGIAVAVDQSTGLVELGSRYARLSVAIPVSLYILSLWTITRLPRGLAGGRALLAPAAAVLVLLTPLSDQGVLMIGLILVALIALEVPGLSSEHGRPAARSAGELGVGRDRRS